MYKEKQIHCVDAMINYIDDGKGDNILFLHNGGGFWQIWTKQLAYFSKTHRVLAIDLPGFGNSGESEKAYDLDYYFEVLSMFIEKMGLKKLNIIGNCIGASLAIKYRSEYPHKITALVMMNICPGERMLPIPLFRKIFYRKRTDKAGKRIIKILAFMLLYSPARWKFPAVLFRKNPEKKSQLYQLYKKKFNERKLSISRAKLYYTSNSFTLTSFLKNTNSTKDALLIWGAENKVAKLNPEGLYHQQVCGIVKLSIIPKGGHLCMYEAPEQVNKLIENYLKS